MGVQNGFSVEVRQRAVSWVAESLSGHESEWSAIRSVAEKIGCTPETPRKWTRQIQVDEGKLPGVSTAERERVQAREREVRELRRANESLRRASAYFAQAELDRRPR